MKRRSNAAVLLLFAFIMTAMPTKVYAAQVSPQREEMQPYYVLITSAMASVSSGKISTTISSVANTKKIVINTTLQKYSSGSWVDQKSWSTTVESSYANLEKTYTMSSGRYRTTNEVTVYKFDRKETVTILSNEYVY